MILVDKTGVIHNDVDENISDSLRKALLNNTENWFDIKGDVMWRRNQDGGLSIFYVAQKPFIHIDITYPELYLFRRNGELYTADAYLYKQTSKLTRVLTDDGGFTIETEMLTSD